ncbi:patatin-like phospholipase [Nitzschia inconspicua]|uniref:Patatin-like phospholipase n=1 Tax=Nitzschia inconspicua TaxID=303405 RepID=A0A9K3LS00_9STRA|nr:patatin-like phospholipase [Nitzschia inconspicua]
MTTILEKDPYIEMLHRVIDEAAIFVVGNFPLFKRATLEALETIFATKTLARQLALAIALETGMVTLSQFFAVINSLLANFSSRSRLIRHLKQQQDRAVDQDEWMDLAERIDNIQGNDVWRSNASSPLYERDRISARIDEFVHLMRRRDIFELMFVLRGGIGRNKFGLLHEGLFSKAMAGTKVLVETYHNVVCASLDFVCDAPVAAGESPIPTDARLAFFNETRHSYGRTALLLSGGAALGFYHVGVVKALMENRLMPRVLGGSSAGSIVCAMIGTRTDEECMNDMFEIKGTNAHGHSGRMMLNFFRPLHLPLDSGLPVVPEEIGEVYRNTAGAFHDFKRTWQALMPIQLRNFTSVLYDLVTLKTRPNELLMSDTEHFRECLRVNVGDFTFQEAFDRTGRILNITVTPNNASDPPRLLNYLTAPHVLVWSAAVASSSLPGVFEANRLMVKDADGTVRYESAESARFSDGSMEQDLPMQQLSEMFNVNHFIISQANPHAVMFASYSNFKSIWSNPLSGFVNSVLKFLKDQCRSWLSNVVELLGARRLAPQHATARGLGAQFFVQEYEGRDCDISLVPWIGHRGVMSALMHALYNPSEQEFRTWVEAAQRETWKHIPAIKSHVAEEITLDRCVQRLRKRVVTESWQKRRKVDSTGAKMGERVPSFFTSPSLVNFGGLAVADPATVNNDQLTGSKKDLTSPHPHIPTTPSIDENHGWGGMGLKGNRSTVSLERSTSDASGLFIDAEDHAVEQVAGEQTNHGPVSPMAKKVSSVISTASSTENGKERTYLKTTNMANFYYRNYPTSHTSLDRMPTRSLSQGEKMEDVPENDTNQRHHARRKSKSHTDIHAVFPPL